jgi:hypothetical protein
MPLLRRYICFPLLLVCGSLFSQVKTLPAIKTTKEPVIDGTLNDSAWINVPEAIDFIQYFPNVGVKASQRTSVKVVYDNSSIYIGAYLYDDPALIRRQITARDEEQQKDLDYFSVFFDTYHDLQNGFQFLVTSSNVQTDARISPGYSPGYGEYGDKTWDAVWESKVSIKQDGWVVEMRIPYISLRFSKNPVQDWGIQFLRSTRRNNETTFWNFVDPQVNGIVNQFGLLKGLENIKPPLRLSFSPYVSTGIRTEPLTKSSGFNSTWLSSGGMDLKYGINESFTLDATIIPDFGQVVSDNVVNNLTPYEVRFEEFRPFFTEGIDIFDKAGLFYSRRIGAEPTGHDDVEDLVDSDPDLEVVKNPGRTRLYNAIKFSGRTHKKLGVGVLNAISSPMYATIRNTITDVKSKIKTEPLANYNIVVLDQALKGRSFITFTNTNVIRSDNGRDANVTGLDVSFFDKRNQFNFRGYAHYSKIFGTTGYDGYNTLLRAGKVSGRFQYFVQNLLRSADYDPTDLGYLATANQHINSGSVAWQQFIPTKNFLSYRYSLNAEYRRLYRPNNFNLFKIEASGFWYFKNFWDTRIGLGYLPDQHDYYLLRKPFNKFARRPQYGYVTLDGSTDSRKRLFFAYNIYLADFFKNPEKDYHILAGSLRYRFSNKLTMELSYRHESETDYIIYGGRDLMNEPVIYFTDFKDVTSVVSGIYNFTPRINLTLRARHYWSQVLRKRKAGVDEDGRPINEVNVSGFDDNVNFFNVDAFFTWDFRLGSRLILGYKNWLGESETVDGNEYKKYLSNFGQTFDLRHGKEFTARFIYFLDYNQLKKKKK